MSLPKLLTVKEAAPRLGISTAMLYKKVKRREIGHYRIDKLIRFSESHLEHFLAWIKGHEDYCSENS
jgi:excisionase family DNA binding protein